MIVPRGLPPPRAYSMYLGPADIACTLALYQCLHVSQLLGRLPDLPRRLQRRLCQVRSSHGVCANTGCYMRRYAGFHEDLLNLPLPGEDFAQQRLGSS